MSFSHLLLACSVISKRDLFLRYSCESDCSPVILYAAHKAAGGIIEGVAVPLMQWPPLVMAGIWNLARVPAIACLLSAKDTPDL